MFGLSMHIMVGIAGAVILLLVILFFKCKGCCKKKDGSCDKNSFSPGEGSGVDLEKK
jgi:hypothetical protein